MHGSLTSPNLTNSNDKLAHWTSVRSNAIKSGDKAEQARAETELANLKPKDRRGLKAATA